MYDASAFAGSWPFDYVGTHSLDEVTGNLAQLGFVGAAVSPLDAVFDPVPAPANAALLRAAEAVEFDVRPVPVINPTLPTWREHLTSCGPVAAVKILPNYHGFDLNDECVNDLAHMVADGGLTLCVQLRMLDERSHHHLARVPATPAAAVHDFALRWPRLVILACGAYWHELAVWRDDANVMAELSFVEDGHLPESLLDATPMEKLALGTHSPIHIGAAAVAKLIPSDLPAATTQPVTDGTFQRLFGASR